VLRIARVATEARVYPLGRPLNVRYDARRYLRDGVFFCESARVQSDFFIGQRRKVGYLWPFSPWSGGNREFQVSTSGGRRLHFPGGQTTAIEMARDSSAIDSWIIEIASSETGNDRSFASGIDNGGRKTAGALQSPPNFFPGKGKGSLRKLFPGVNCFSSPSSHSRAKSPA